MAGLLNASKQQAEKPMATEQPMADDNIDDPILQRIERGIEAKVPPDMKQAYLAVIVAGMRVMYSEETAHMMDDQLQASDDLVTNVSEGIAKLMMMLHSESKGKMSIPAAALASISLMAQALDYAEKKFGIEVTPEIAAAATKATTTAVLKVFGIDQADVEKQIAAKSGGAPQPGQPAAQPPAGV